ncbi:sugar phosphate permease [Scopulibacillus darangshiensis]|uniref:Sugar phosphate permease n=2 Tax=Scopulibacillus darangshiensis TaxID=442528 RepID=A0A4R2P9J9_9BACL|nr:sugar phosphate permease [Scopulibacillus darangshiensis]
MKRSRARWLYIAPPIFFFWVFGQMDKLGISVIITNEDFLKDMDLLGDTAKIGFLMTGFLVLYGLANIAWGFIVDRIGPRKTAIIGTVIWGLTMILGGLSSSYGLFMISRMILGIGEAVLFPVCNKFISNWFPPKEFGRAQSTWIIGDYLGPAIGIPIIIFTIGLGGWEASFFLLAVFSFLINLPLFIFLTRDQPKQHYAVNKVELQYIQDGQGSQHANNTSFKDLLKNYKYWMIWFVMLVDSVLFYGISFWLPTYLEKARHFSTALMSSWTSTAWILALVTVLLVGYIADKTRKPSLIGAVIFVIGAGALFTAVSTEVSYLAAAMMGVGLAAVGGVLEISQLLLVDYSSKETAGKAAGLMGFTNIVGGFTTAFMGYLVDVSGGNFTTAIAFLIINAALGAIALFTLVPGERKKPLNQKQDINANA